MKPADPAVPPDDAARRRILALAAAALFLLVAGVRLWLIGRYGTDLPYWDQWDAEAAGVFQRYFAGTLGLGDWFAPHNEHRIPFARLIAFALMRADGQWDARVQTVVNALLFAVVAVVLHAAAARGAGRARALLLGAFLAALFALPYGWENTLAGFQSQFYLLGGFSVAALYLLPGARPFSGAWAAGAAASVGALLSLGSGLLAPVAVVGVLALAVLRNRRDARGAAREAAPTLAVCVALIVAGAALRVPMPAHEPLRAHGLGELVASLLAYLAWPWTSRPAWVLAAWIPVLVLAVAYVRGQVPDGPRERFVLGLAGWAMLQAAALTYSRTGQFETSRYGDILAFGVIANVLAASRFIGRGARGRAATVAFAVWLAATGAGVARVSFDGAISARALEYAVQRRSVAGFVETDDLAWLRAPAPAGLGFAPIPYPDIGRLAALLRDQDLRQILPASVQRRPAVTVRAGRPAPRILDPWEPGDAPDSWERAVRFAPDAPGNAGGFALEIEKRADRPVLLLYARGGPLSITTSAGEPGRIVALGARDDRGWRPVLASCPARRCVVSGSAGAGGTELTEPREIGWLAAAAFVVTWEAWIAIVAGALVAGAAIVAASRAPRGAAVAMPRAPEGGAS